MTNTIEFCSLTDAQLIARFLRARNGKSPQERANAIMEHCNGYQTLLNNRSKTTQLLTDTEHQHLRAALEIATRYTMNQLELEGPLSSPQAVRDYLSLKLSGLEHE